MRKKEKSKTIYLVTGGNGLIGSYFLKSPSFLKNSEKLAEKNIFLAPSHSHLDVSDFDLVRRYIKLKRPDVVIHFAAFRNATEAEKERGSKRGRVWRTNVLGSQNLARVSKEFNVYLVSISSDYIFSGYNKNPGPYSETDPAERNDELLSWYGITKKEAEKVIQENLDNAAIIRIGNVTQPGEISNLDYIGKILWLYQQQKLYPLFHDQFLTLTYIPTIAEVVHKLSEKKLKGVFHIASRDLLTPYQLACYLIEQAQLLRKDFLLKKQKLKKVSINKFLETNPRRYPKFGGLKAELTQEKLGLKFHNWREIVHKFLFHS